MDETQDTQVPEKPTAPKKEKAKSGMNPIVMAGIIAGIVVATVTLVFIGFSIFIMPSLNQGNSGVSQDSIASDGKGTQEQELSPKSKLDYDINFLTDDEKAKVIFESTGRITTNPKNAPSKFVVIDLGLSFLPKEEKDLQELKGDKSNSKLWKMIMAETRHSVNNSIRSLTTEELEATPTDSLVNIFSKEIEPIFSSKKILLTKVLIQEFIIQ